MDKQWSYPVVLAGLSLIILSGCDGGGTSGSSSGSSKVNATNPLNDTGVSHCGTIDSSSNTVNCDAGIFLPAGGGASIKVPHPQDGDHGRDVSDNSNSDGQLGFQFTKLDNSGDALPADATQAVDNWTCTRDEVTGLTWEVKELSNTSSPRYYDNTFSWFSDDSDTNGGEEGTSDSGVCSGSIDCDTQSLATWVNDNGGLCGQASGWRLPSREELHGLMDYGHFATTTTPAIDTDYFPGTNQGNSQTTLYWSATTYAGSETQAWRAYFGSADAPAPGAKSIAMRVRLVHD